MTLGLPLCCCGGAFWILQVCSRLGLESSVQGGCLQAICKHADDKQQVIGAWKRLPL